MTEVRSFRDTERQDAGHHERRPVFRRPDEVLNDPNMSRAEKRALLASRASDFRAVADAPSMRELHNGSLVEVDEILRALKALDANDVFAVLNRRPDGPRHMGPARRRLFELRAWPRIVRRRRRNDDDDDPPPCPVRAPVPPRFGGGGAYVHPEPALA